MPESKFIHDFSKLNHLQLANLKKQIENKESIKDMHRIKKENIQRQKINNLKNEYIRIRNYLDSKPVHLKGLTPAHLEKRIKEIEDMKIFDHKNLDKRKYL